jgi:hypothetical protein
VMRTTDEYLVCTVQPNITFRMLVPGQVAGVFE